MIHHPFGSVVKAGLDIASISLIIGSFMDFLPKIAAGVSAVYYAYLIYEKYSTRKK